MESSHKICPIKAIESCVLSEFKKQSSHLRNEAVSKEMQDRLYEVALPFHLKLKELGYKPDESIAMLRKAFDHQPPRTMGRSLRLTVFG